MAVTINGSAGVTTNSGAVYNGISSGTAVTASGTSIDFTSIPSWVKRITVMFNGVSTNGTSVYLVQLGDSGGVETTGYRGASVVTYTTNATLTTSSTSGFPIFNNAAADTHFGCMILTNVSGNNWVAIGNDNQTGSWVASQAGGKELSATLDRVRITTVNGTDTFDAGSINILYE